MSAKKHSMKIYDGYRIPYDFFPYQEFREAVDYEPNERDLFVVSFPKSGTTWTQYIVWEILTDGAEPPFVNEMWYTLGAQIELIGAKRMLEIPVQTSHRLIKSHLPFEYIPYNFKGKYIYIARNPYEVCLSYYKDACNTPTMFGDYRFDEWVDLFISGNTAFGDYFDHIILWFKNKDHKNVLFITYEEMKNNPKEHILKISEFIGTDYKNKLDKSPEILNKIIRYTDFEYMKTIPFILAFDFEKARLNGLDAKKNLDWVNQDKGYKLHDFFNVGKVGHSLEMYSEKQIKQISDKCNEKFAEIPQLLQIWRSFGIKV